MGLSLNHTLRVRPYHGGKSLTQAEALRLPTSVENLLTSEACQTCLALMYSVLVLAVLVTALSGTSLARVYAAHEDIPPMPMTTMLPVDHLSRSNSSSDANVPQRLRTLHNAPTRSSNTSERSDDDDSEGSSDDDSEGSSDDNSSDSDDDTSNSGLATTSAVMNAAFKLGSVMNATSTIEQTYTNWVGTALNTASSTSCWRRAHIAKTCPLGYDSRLGMCWSQCPYSYPVECGLECSRQNDECFFAIVSKVAVVVQTSLSLTSWSVYGDMRKWSRGIQLAIKCTKYMISLSKSLLKYIRYLKIYDPQATQDKILTKLYQIDNVIIDIPVSISYCLEKRVADEVKFTDMVVMTAEYALREIITYGSEVISSWTAFTKFMKKIALGDSISSLNEVDITSLKSALKSNSTCGYDMKRLLDRTWMTVAELRRLNPEISEDDIRVIMSQSNLMLKDIPIATNNCMIELIEQSNEDKAYGIRDTLRKTFNVIVDDLITSGTSSNGTYLSAQEYAVKIADRVIGMWSIWDPFYLPTIYSEYFEPLCSHPELIGEVDDGNVKMALGMSIVQGAFNNSDGMWTKIGDDSVTITFKSVDTKDVTVNIKSGGNKIDEVDVPAGKTVTWKSSVTALGGKTLYLNRRRPSFLDIPITGGGSLLLYVPRSSQGGSLQLTAMLNPS